LEGAIAVAEQNTHGADWPNATGYGDILFTVIIEIADCHEAGVTDGRNAANGLKCAIAVTQQNADPFAARPELVACISVGRDDVEDTVAVNVCHCGHSCAGGRVTDRICE
jgi:hypothetical protein